MGGSELSLGPDTRAVLLLIGSLTSLSELVHAHTPISLRVPGLGGSQEGPEGSGHLDWGRGESGRSCGQWAPGLGAGGVRGSCGQWVPGLGGQSGRS